MTTSDTRRSTTPTRLAARAGSALRLAVAAALLGLSTSACYAHARPAVYGYDADYVDGGYGAIYGAPGVSWNGGYAYWYDDHWWYRHGGRWVVLRREPPELYRWRSNRYGGSYRAPPAYRAPSAGYRPRGYSAPPAYRAPSPGARPRGYSAPPAGRGGGPYHRRR